MLPSNDVEQLNLEYLFLKINSSIHESTFLLKVEKNISGKEVCKIIYILKKKKENIYFFSFLGFFEFM